MGINLKGYSLKEPDAAAVEEIARIVGGFSGGVPGSGVSSINGATGNVVLKTINGEDLIGPGNIAVAGGAGGGGVATSFSTSILYDLEYRYYSTVRNTTSNDVYVRNTTAAIVGGRTTWALQLDGSHLPDLTALGTQVGTVVIVQETNRIYEVTAWKTVAGYYYEVIKGDVSTAADTIRPTLLSAAVTSALPTRVTLAWSEPMSASISAPAAFGILGHTITAHTIIDPTHTFLSLSAPFAGGEIGTLSYTQPSTNLMQDLAGNLLDNFAGFLITNTVAGPALVSADVLSTALTGIDLTWNQPMSSVISAPSAFGITGGGHPLVGHAYLDSTHTRLTTSVSYSPGELTTLSYVPPAINKMTDAAGSGLVAAFSGFTINAGSGSSYSSGNYDIPDTYDY